MDGGRNLVGHLQLSISENSLPTLTPNDRLEWKDWTVLTRCTGKRNQISFTIAPDSVERLLHVQEKCGRVKSTVQVIGDLLDNLMQLMSSAMPLPESVRALQSRKVFRYNIYLPANLQCNESLKTTSSIICNN